MEIEKIIINIQERNKRVEQDKAWEISWTRRFAIGSMIYAAAVAWLLIIDEPDSWLKALVPVLGYILSTLTLRQIRRVWRKDEVS